MDPVEVGAALMQCVSLLAPVSAEVIPLAPVRYNDCGTPAPVLLRSIGGKDKIAVDPPLVMNCPMVAALASWMEKTVQPAARATFGSPVARIAGPPMPAATSITSRTSAAASTPTPTPSIFRRSFSPMVGW